VWHVGLGFLFFFFNRGRDPKAPELALINKIFTILQEGPEGKGNYNHILPICTKDPRIISKTPSSPHANPDLAGDAFATIASRVLAVKWQGEEGLPPEVEGGGEEQFRRILWKPE
jgi:hypothetical protein